MAPDVLASLGRTHDPVTSSSVRSARDAGFESFNSTSIYGAGRQIDDGVELTARRARSATHQRVRLTVEPGTPLADEPERHPDDDDQADKTL